MPARIFHFSNTKYVLDARSDRLDLRDRMYLPPVRSLAQRHPSSKDLQKLMPKYVKAGLILDQGQEGACTGFGLAAVVNFLLWKNTIASDDGVQLPPVSPYMLYDLARFYDEWPGENYEGSSCRGAMKGWHKHGACQADLWTSSVQTKKGKNHYRPHDAWSGDAINRALGVYTVLTIDLSTICK